MKNPKYTFCREFNVEHTKKILDDDVIIVTSSVHRTQSIGVLFSPPVITHNSLLSLNSRGMREKNE